MRSVRFAHSRCKLCDALVQAGGQTIGRLAQSAACSRSCQAGERLQVADPSRPIPMRCANTPGPVVGQSRFGVATMPKPPSFRYQPRRQPPIVRHRPTHWGSPREIPRLRGRTFASFSGEIVTSTTGFGDLTNHPIHQLPAVGARATGCSALVPVERVNDRLPVASLRIVSCLARSSVQFTGQIRMNVGTTARRLRRATNRN